MSPADSGLGEAGSSCLIVAPADQYFGAVVKEQRERRGHNTYCLISIQAEHEELERGGGWGWGWGWRLRESGALPRSKRFKEQFPLSSGRLSGSEDRKVGNPSPFTRFTGYWKHRGVSLEWRLAEA